MEYVELITKSNFSFLTGASHPEELVGTAIAQGLRGMAMTDFNGVYGLGRGFRQAKHHPEFRYIIGAELSFANHSPLVLLAKNRSGYAQLCRLISLAHAGKAKNQAHLNFEEFFEARKNSTPDLIALARPVSSGGLITRWAELLDIFSHQLYLPLCRHLDGKDRIRTQEALQISRSLGVPIVATNEVQYHIKSRKPLQDVLISIREGKPLGEVGCKLFPNAERFLKTPAQMLDLFSDLPEAISNTMKIADLCTFSPRELRYRYPSEWIPQGMTAIAYLEHLVWQNAPVIYQKKLQANGQIPQNAADLLRHELQLIRQLEYADYFLTIYDIVKFAREKEILCQGRGSAANSVVCYVLGITAVDPVQMDFLFERFISAERNEPPDIDVDFEHERREEVIQYIYAKYGRDRAAMVSAVVTYQERSAFREVSKAFGVPVGSLSAKDVDLQFEELTKDFVLKEGLRERISHFAEQLTGFPRHLSIHSGGFTLSADPIIDIVPVEPARMEGRTIVQWDKYDLDELGLLKVDVLSLGMLSCLRKALALTNYKLHELPLEDEKTYKMIQNCDTIGTFQIESRAQISMLGRLQPAHFYDLVIEVAIMRPGPIVGNMVHPFLKRRHGLEKVEYPNKTVERILGKTMGVPLFQEQIMKLAIELANFTPGEADRLRRTINAWRSSAPIAEMSQRLMTGLIQGGLPESFAQQIFEQIQGFSHYGFPESHAASFAQLAYASSYLKCHHPAEFTASLLNSQPLGFYRNDTLIFDALRHGVKILPVCVHKSVWDCQMEGPKTIRLGFRVVKGLAQKDVEELVREREELGFKSLTDFLKRSSLRRDVLHRLAMAGRLSSRELDARQTLWTVLEYENLFSGPEQKQLSLLDRFHELDASSESSFTPLNDYEKVQEDYKAFHLSTQNHPMRPLRSLLKSIPSITSKDLSEMPHGKTVRVAGLVLVRQKPPTAKGVTFCTLEDEDGTIDLILHREVYVEFKEVFMMNSFLIATGRLQRSGNSRSLLVKNVQAIDWTPKHQGIVSAMQREATNYFHW